MYLIGLIFIDGSVGSSQPLKKQIKRGRWHFFFSHVCALGSLHYRSTHFNLGRFFELRESLRGKEMCMLAQLSILRLKKAQVLIIVGLPNKQKQQ